MRGWKGPEKVVSGLAYTRFHGTTARYGGGYSRKTLAG